MFQSPFCSVFVKFKNYNKMKSYLLPHFIIDNDGSIIIIEKYNYEKSFVGFN